MASSTSSYCGDNRQHWPLARQWYAHTAGICFLWTRFATPLALAALFLTRAHWNPSALLAFLLGPFAAALYAAGYLLMRWLVRVPLLLLKWVDAFILLAAVTGSAVVISTMVPPELRWWLWLPGAGLAALAWYINWCWEAGGGESTAEEIPAPPAFLSPVLGPITAGFRSYDKSHSGVDIGVGLGTPILAPADGRILHAGPLEQWGHTVILDHGNGWTTLFAHLNRPAVRRGTVVHAGALVAWSGTSGISTGPHVHMELRYEDNPVDPAPLLEHESGAQA